jgi:type I restriction enzyme S subunit
MGLKKYKIGEFVEPYSQRCGISDLIPEQVSGINIDKEFFEPAKQVGEDTSNYKIVPPDYFACNLMHVGRDYALPVAINHSDKDKYVSPAYTIFKLKDENLVLKEYFFILLKSSEKDRYFAFHTDSSIRQGLPWEDFCDIDITLPSIEQQRKYVDVYLALQNNLAAYQSKVEDLKMVCDGYFDKAKKGNVISLGELIERVDKRNTDGFFKEDSVKGITNKKQFDDTKADLIDADLSKFLVIDKGVFAYNSRTDGRDMLVLALNKEEHGIIVTWNYNAFRIKDEYKTLVNPEYLYSFFLRSEFDRRVRFNSWGSSQELLSWDNFCNIKVPFPGINEQDSIAKMNHVFLERKAIVEQLKERLNGLCPILIRGSLTE